MKPVIMLCLSVSVLACGEPSEQADRAEESPPAATAEAVPGGEPVDVQIEECQHAPVASIYNRPAALWRAEQHEAGNSLSLTVWRMTAGGAEEFSLYTTQGGNTYRIDTVTGSAKVGEGTVSVTPEGEGVRFEVNGKDQSGNELRATVRCSRLVPLVAEGG